MVSVSTLLGRGDGRTLGFPTWWSGLGGATSHGSPLGCHCPYGYRSYQVGKNCQAEGVGRMERKSVLLLPLQGTCEFLGYLNPVGAGLQPRQAHRSQ